MAMKFIILLMMYTPIDNTNGYEIMVSQMPTMADCNRMVARIEAGSQPKPGATESQRLISASMRGNVQCTQIMVMPDYVDNMFVTRKLTF
jgi:hypothetical protein